MGSRFVSIRFQYLKTDWLCRREPDRKKQPLVMTSMVHGRMVITEANAAAGLHGICSGMVVADARALTAMLQVVEEPIGLTEKLLRKIAEWCIRFTPAAAIDLPDGLLLDASGCTHLWGGDKPYLTAIYQQLQSKGFTIHLSIADTIGAAWAVNRYVLKGKIIAPCQQVEALKSLPVAALRLASEITERMHSLGLNFIEQLMQMPVATLRRRFGEDCVLKLQQATGAKEEYLTPVVAPVLHQDRLPCLEPIITATGIEIALQQLLGQMCSRLQQQQKGLRKVLLKCYKTSGEVLTVSVQTNHPSHHAEHIFELFALQIAQVNPEPGIELFLLEAPVVEEHVARQEWLWSTATPARDAKLAELADRITIRLGENHIRRFIPVAHYWPERSYTQASRITDNASADWPRHLLRPVQIATPPEPIVVTAPVPDYPPMSFRYKGVLHKIIKADGPERIEQEWWLQQGQHRDYYRVEDEDGGRYWLFRLGHYDAIHYQWYLHGFFA